MTGMVSNSVNFGSTPLHQVNLRKGDGSGFVRAVVSELDPKCEEDFLALSQVAKDWNAGFFVGKILNFFEACRGSLTSHQNNPELQDWIVKNNPQTYYAVELLHEAPLHEKIAGLLMATFKRNTLHNCRNLDLSLLQVRPDIMYQDGVDNSARRIKGVGEVLVGQVFRHAKESAAPSITITSSNDYFYYETFKKSGVEMIDDRLYDYTAPFTIKSGEFDKYLGYTEQKYQIKF